MREEGRERGGIEGEMERERGRTRHRWTEVWVNQGRERNKGVMEGGRETLKVGGYKISECVEATIFIYYWLTDAFSENKSSHSPAYLLNDHLLILCLQPSSPKPLAASRN